MPAEFVAQRGDHFGGERIFLARRKAGKKGKHQHRHGHAFFNRFFNRPAALAGIFDVAFDRRKLGIF